MHKRILLVCLLALSLAAAPSAGGEAPLRVVVSFYPLYIAAINIARDVPGVQVNVMAPPSAGCLHDYQLTTADRRSVEDADIVIINGAGLEAFMEKVLAEVSGKVIDASAGLALLPDAHHGANPHVWVSLDGMAGEIENIARGLAEADPAHAEGYQENAAAYIEKLHALAADIGQQLAPYAGEPIVTFHEAFDYFAQDFGLNIVATIQNEHGAAPSARDLAVLSTLLREQSVKALFAEPQYEDASVDLLAKETGLPVSLLDPAVSGEMDAGDFDAYLRIMQQNADTIAEALQ